MHKYLEIIRKKAAENPQRIVFPEGGEERILQAVEEILKQNLAKPILIGEKNQIMEKANQLGLALDWEQIEIYSTENSPIKEKLAQEYFELRKEKGLSYEEALSKIEDINYFGTMLVKMGYADGMVTGTTFPTGDSIRPALELLRIKEQFHKVSGVFFMVMEERLLLFADAAITINPTAEELAFVAIDTAETAKKFGIVPKIALLSFSTFSSSQGPEVDKVKQTLKFIREKRPDLIVDGEMQVDAALVPGVAKRKCPKSQIQGDANILIFPNLEAANIAYKLVERLAGAEAIGPLLQGLNKPINDLSRGCSYHDIVNISAFTAYDCIE